MRAKKFDLSEFDVRFDKIDKTIETLDKKLDNSIDRIDKTFEKSELQRAQDAKDREERYNALMDRLAQDAREREERLAQDAREREQRSEQRAQAMEERHMADRREFRSQKRWLIANFVGVAAIIFGFFLAVIGFVVAVANGYLPV